MKINKIIIITVILSMISFFYACNASSSSADVSVNTPGDRSVPVRVISAEYQSFSRQLNYTAVLEGSVQSEARSNVGGVLKNVNVRVGQSVKKDQIIASFDEDLPESGYLQAESAYNIANTTYERMKNLYDAGGISRQQLDEAETQYRIARANYTAAKKSINVLAPIEGIISNIHFRKGDNVNRGEPIATIVDFSKLNCKIWVDEKDVSGFYEGLDTRVSWRGYDGNFTGYIDRVAMSANPQRRAFEVEIGIDNKQNKLKPGVLVEVRADIFRVEEAVVVPRLLIQEENGKEYVFIIKDNTAHRVYIRTGIESGSLVEISEGISPGDLVVIEGQFSLTDQVRVRIID